MARMSSQVGYRAMVAITKSDTVGIRPCDAIISTGAGNLVVVDSMGNVVTLTAIPVGTVVPVKVVRLNSTSTTGTAAALYY